jgi:RHS repeat-associated protein
MDNLTKVTDYLGRGSTYTYDLEGNLQSITDSTGRTETMTCDIAGRVISYHSPGGNSITYDYDKLNNLIEKTYEGWQQRNEPVLEEDDTDNQDGTDNQADADTDNLPDPQTAPVQYAYDALGQRIAMNDPTGNTTYTYDGLGRIISATTYRDASKTNGDTISYTYDKADNLLAITYPDGTKVTYTYDLNDNLTKVTDRHGDTTTYTYDAINRITEIHRPTGISTYNTYNARDQITNLINTCDECGWTVSSYAYTYDDRGFITDETAIESLAQYAYDDKHAGKHEDGSHDDLYPHGNKHNGKHDKDDTFAYQIIVTDRTFTYDQAGKLLSMTETEDNYGTYTTTYEYDLMGNRTAIIKKDTKGKVVESESYSYNESSQKTSAEIYDGKKTTTLTYTYDPDGNLISEIGRIGTDNVANYYNYTVENRLEAVYDSHELLMAAAYDGDGNRVFQLNYNLHTDEDWKGNSGNGNGSNKDNSGSGNSGNGNSSNTSTTSKTTTSTTSTTTGSNKSTGSNKNTGNSSANSITGTSTAADHNTSVPTDIVSTETTTNKGKGNSNKDKTSSKVKSKGSSSKQSDTITQSELIPQSEPTAQSEPAAQGDSTTLIADADTHQTAAIPTATANGPANPTTGNGNTTNAETNTSQNQSGILFPIADEVSEVEQSLIDQVKTTGKEKNYELIEYLNDINRTYAEVLVEQNINGVTDTTYTYGVTRLSLTRFDESSGYYLYDPKGSVTGVTNEEGQIYQSYRYDPFGEITFGEPQYENEYTYNGESYNPNIESQYLRARYYDVITAAFLTEDSYLGNIAEPLTLNRYNYVLSSPLNYIDPSGHFTTAEGKEAHEALQNYLEVLYPNQVVAEYQVIHHPTNPRETGRIDVLYKGITKWEVYEIKPISYQNSPYKGQAIQQRENYIIALEAMREKEIERGDNAIKNVDPTGRTLDTVISSTVLPSALHPDKSIKYYTDSVNPGIIYWGYNKKPKSEPYLVRNKKEAESKERVIACFENQSAYGKIGNKLIDVMNGIQELAAKNLYNGITNALDFTQFYREKKLSEPINLSYPIMDFIYLLEYFINSIDVGNGDISKNFNRHMYEMAPFYSEFARSILLY